MKDIIFNSVSKIHYNEYILKDFSFKIPGGSFFVLLGPSGSGKTTLLRLIGGLDKPDKGTIFLGNENINTIKSEKRKINIVFQNYALFPHMTILDNIKYGLKVKNYADIVIEEKTAKAIIMFNVEKFVHKYPHEISGGQQQRVALARAIINEPDVLLLDEPLSALDLKTKEKILLELIDLQKKLQMTFVYVTHDQYEALAVADYMAVMNDRGEIEQSGTPYEIYENPKNTFIAKFVGNSNLLEGEIERKEQRFIFNIKNLNKQIDISSGIKNYSDILEYTILGIRPEKIIMRHEDKEPFYFKGIITSIVYFGKYTEYSVKIDENNTILVSIQNNNFDTVLNFIHKQIVYLYWNPENIILLKK